jgi:hypothetical protein
MTRTARSSPATSTTTRTCPTRAAPVPEAVREGPAQVPGPQVGPVGPFRRPDLRRVVDHKHVVPDREIPRGRARQAAVPIYEAIDPGINKDHQAAWCSRGATRTTCSRCSMRSSGPTGPSRTSRTTSRCSGPSTCSPRWTVIDPAAQNRHHSPAGHLQWEYQKPRGLDDAGPEQPAGGLQRRQGTLKADPPKLVVVRRRVTS